MSRVGPHHELTFDGPFFYRIRVRGFLDETWSARLGGMTFCISHDRGHGIVTTLVGRLLDQAALLGVLTALYNLELPILSVESLQTDGP